MLSCASIHEAMTTLAGNRLINSEQHAEMSISRKIGVNGDLEKLSEWFKNHNPFVVSAGGLRSLTRRLRPEMQVEINCDHAEDVGTKIRQKMDHANVLHVSI